MVIQPNKCWISGMDQAAVLWTCATCGASLAARRDVGVLHVVQQCTLSPRHAMMMMQRLGRWGMKPDRLEKRSCLVEPGPGQLTARLGSKPWSAHNPTRCLHPRIWPRAEIARFDGCCILASSGARKNPTRWCVSAHLAICITHCIHPTSREKPICAGYFGLGCSLDREHGLRRNPARDGKGGEG